MCLIHSAKVCEEKLRYAAYNCVAIDTDMSPWEEWPDFAMFTNFTQQGFGINEL